MEKKKNIWVGKIVVIVLIIVSIGSYYVFSVRKTCDESGI